MELPNSGRTIPLPDTIGYKSPIARYVLSHIELLVSGIP